jgi:hypothetical protein
MSANIFMQKKHTTVACLAAGPLLVLRVMHNMPKRQRDVEHWQPVLLRFYTHVARFAGSLCRFALLSQSADIRMLIARAV